tara:strand:- start:2453 stop:3241 length:789 start_codon:yes stop_codon:yes gene_type:complete
MISLLEIAKNINEVDDDKIIKYKDKDGESQEMTAGAAKKMDKEHPAKQAWDKMSGQEKGGDDSEKDDGDKLGGSDFDRDGGDDREEDPNYLFKQDDDDDEDESNVADANDDVIRSLEGMDLNGLDVNSVSSEIDDGMYAELMGKDVDEPDNAMTVTAFEDGGKIEYGINVGIGHEVIYFDSKEEALEATQKLAKDDKIRKAMDGEGDETLADLGDYANSIVKGKDETITINGKTYKPIKEGKKKPNSRILKENYDRIFRSLK